MRGALILIAVLALAASGWSGRAAARQQGAAVRIVDFAFQPESITVEVGATMTWTQAGQAPHTVTSETRLFDSGRLDPGQTFAFTLTAPGTFAYRCEVHPARMAGTVIVQGAAGSGGPQRLGTLTPDTRGNATFTYTDGQRRNLIALFDRMAVTAETGTGAQPTGGELLRGEVNAVAMVHMRRLLAGIEVTPKNTPLAPLATGLLEQMALAAEHARLARAAVQNNDLATARLRLVHVVNIVEGERAPTSVT